MKIGCVGDVHIGAGVNTYGAERLADQEQALTDAFNLFADEGCELVLIAGDTWDGPLVPPEQYVAFARALKALDEIPAVMISGNGSHDLATRETNALRVFEATYRPNLLDVKCEPGIVRHAGVAVACLPWAGVAKYVAHRNGGSRDDIHAEVAEMVVGIARDLRARCEADTAVLLAHWSVTDAALPSGLPVGLVNEPILDAGALSELDFDAVVLGHIHRPQDIAGDPRMFYVGSPLTLNHGEAGYEHGCWVFDTESGPTFHPLRSRRFVTVDYDFTQYVDWFVAERAARPPRVNVEDAIVRVRYAATEEQARTVDAAQIRSSLVDSGAWRVSIEPTIIRDQQARIALAEDADDLDAFDQWCAAEGIEDSLLPQLHMRNREFCEQVPA